MSKRLNCPQCGDVLNINIKYSKLTRCNSCKSTIFLEDDAIKNLGKMNLLSDEPSPLKLQQKFRYGEKEYFPMGKIRYSYELGFWEEWFVLDSQEKPYWISVDEGNLILEKRFDLPKNEIQWIIKESRLSSTVTIQGKRYRVTEKDEGICQGFDGELPRAIKVSTKLNYLHLSSLEENWHITLEEEEGEYMAYIGRWLDIYEMELNNG